MSLRNRRYRPFARNGKGIIVAIFATFVLISALSLYVSISATGRSKNRAAEIEVVARQRTLAERYVKEVLMVRAGEQADPAFTGSVMARSVTALLDGGTAPEMNGDDDSTDVPPASGAVIRHQLEQEQRLVKDLTSFGAALLAQAPHSAASQSGGERVTAPDPLKHLEILGALASNVALNTARDIASQTDNNISHLTVVQVALGVGGLLVSLLLASGLILTSRRQTAHFRSLVNSSSDLVVVIGSGGCRYASRSLCRMVGRPEAELLGQGLTSFVHEDDRHIFAEAHRWAGKTMMLRVVNAAGEWRNLEAHVTDLRGDRHLRGIVLNARDVTERVQLERELTLQTQRDAFGSQLGEALEMADDEGSAYEVIERAMIEISDVSPMELLLSDASHANLERAAASPSAGAPGCPVSSPYSCVAVRRGQAVEFASSEALNACPKLRGRPDGPCSAVCVPVSFMGRALGVLHATGPQDDPPDAEQFEQLTTLATQAGGRIGTVRAFEKTQLQAATDSLTGLVNRRTFEREVRSWLSAGRQMALAVADLDYFKAVNDTYGHEAGDRALRLFSQVCKETVRDGDLVGRWGGEEFVFALPGIDSERAVEVFERLRMKLAGSHTGGHPRFTASFGVTDSNQSTALEQLILIADSGLYQSKHEGRDRITIGTTPIDAPALLREASAHGPAPDEPTPKPGFIRPMLHEAADEEEPRPSGVEIR
jgi:diguanylate cyclase (GGDEF)-like protein/PAS domain S-box-containing protein